MAESRRKSKWELVAERFAGNWKHFSPPFMWGAQKPEDPGDWTVQRLFDPTRKAVNMSQVWAFENDMTPFTKGRSPTAIPLQMSGFAMGWTLTWGVKCFDRRYVLPDVTGAFQTLISLMQHFHIEPTFGWVLSPRRAVAIAGDVAAARIDTILYIEDAGQPMLAETYDPSDPSPPAGWPTLVYYWFKDMMPAVVESVETRGVPARPSEAQLTEAMFGVAGRAGSKGISVLRGETFDWFVSPEELQDYIYRTVRPLIEKRIRDLADGTDGERLVSEDVPRNWEEQVFEEIFGDEEAAKEHILGQWTEWEEAPLPLFPGMTAGRITGRRSTDDLVEFLEPSAGDVAEALVGKGWYESDEDRAEKERDAEEERRQEDFEDETMDKGIDDRIDANWIAPVKIAAGPRRGWLQVGSPVTYRGVTSSDIAKQVYRWLEKNAPGQVEDDGESNHAEPDEFEIKRALKALGVLDLSDDEYDDIDDDIDPATLDLVGGPLRGKWYNANLAGGDKAEGQAAVDSTIFVDMMVVEKVPRAEVELALRAHFSGDFGVVDRATVLENRVAMMGPQGTIRSVYPIGRSSLKVITDASHDGTYVSLA